MCDGGVVEIEVTRPKLKVRFKVLDVLRQKSMWKEGPSRVFALGKNDRLKSVLDCRCMQLLHQAMDRS